MHRFVSTIIVGALLLTACSDEGITVPATLSEVLVGTIGAVQEGDEVLRLPAGKFRAGEPSTITVVTYGSSCVSPAGAHVTQDAMHAVVTPLDFVTVNTGCYLVVAPYPRPVVLVFTRPGLATITVRGRSPLQHGLVSVDHTVTVLP